MPNLGDIVLKGWQRGGVTCGDTRCEFTAGRGINGLGDITRETVTGATVIARAAAQWRDHLIRLAEAGSLVGERFGR